MQEYVAKKSLFRITFLSPWQNVSYFNVLVCYDVIQEMSLSFFCSTFSTDCGDKNWYTLLTSECRITQLTSSLSVSDKNTSSVLKSLHGWELQKKAEEYKEIAKIPLSMKRA